MSHAYAAVRISNISDIDFGSWGIGDGALSRHIDVCIYAFLTVPAGGYSVTISSPGGYVLKNGAQQIPYTLSWEDAGAGSLGSGNGVQLANGLMLGGLGNANILSSNCALTGANARLTIRITESAMRTALAGSYSGTISLLIGPP